MAVPARTAKTLFDNFDEITDVLAILHEANIGYIFTDSKFTPAVSILLTAVAYEKATKLLPDIFPPKRGVSPHGERLEWRIKTDGSVEFRMQHGTL